MRAQDHQYNCGPNALHNALAALGVRRSARELEVVCGTTAQDGTSQTRLVEAARAIRGTKPWVLESGMPAPAIAMLRDALHRGRPAVLAVDRDEHYIAAIGMLGDRVLVADGANNEVVLSVPDYKLLLRWDNQTGLADAFWACVL